MDKQTALHHLLDRCFAARIPVYELCQLAGVSPSTVSRWKQRPETIGPRTLGRLEAEMAKYEREHAA
jgi:uncharacterized protein YjcR